MTRAFFRQVNGPRKRKSSAAHAKMNVEQALEDFMKSLDEISLEG